MMPVSRPSLGVGELNAIQPIFESGQLGLGSVTCELEKEIGKYVGAKNVIAVNTGTSVLHLALDGYGDWYG